MHNMPETNLRSLDRVLELAPIEGKSPLNSLGTADKRLFTGEQKLHVKMDPSSTLWYFQWEQNGVLPAGLRGHFTGANQAIKHAEAYFFARNVKVTKVND